jgi:hypothetical protein
MAKTLHGKTDTFEFSVWTAMHKRCYYNKHPKYHLYGGRGIVICDEWRNDFSKFLSDMGECPFKGGSIDRINSDGNYEPNNCRWILKSEQSANRRCVKYIDGMSIEAYARTNNVPASTLRLRIKQGWTNSQLLTIKRERWSKQNALRK